MQIKKENEEVIYSCDPVIKMDAKDIYWLKNKSAQNERKRIRLCTHKSTEDSVHEMLIVHQRDTYVRPHKHLGKPESFHIIEGRADVVLFDDTGNMNNIIKMGQYGSGLVFYYRISTPVYHTLLIHSDILVFHETTSGPFNRSDTVFAAWSPVEEDKEACKSYMLHLSQQTAC